MPAATTATKKRKAPSAKENDAANKRAKVAEDGASRVRSVTRLMQTYVSLYIDDAQKYECTSIDAQTYVAVHRSMLRRT
ncbi:hypothetical protein NMY22_g20098 [Coprinellus aureogranulatus]|nr:hypothetical protein NMY22_g20098 [Coprinellus aureogranulatus]